ncbi:hypothetical protein ACFE04_030331 [Oxalis oulophora]
MSTTTNLLDLPDDITVIILLKLSTIDIIASAQYLCVSWRRLICKHPSMWRHINMCDNDLGPYLLNYDLDLEKVCKHAVDRSQGNLIEINIEYFATDELLHYIAQRASGLKRLRLVSCNYISGVGFIEAASKFPLLEELDLSLCYFPEYNAFDLEVLRKIFPLLRCFKFKGIVWKCSYSDGNIIEINMENFATDELFHWFARRASGLKRLRLVSCYGISDKGLIEAASKFPLLEELELTLCNFSGIALEAVGKSCPLLSCFKFNNNHEKFFGYIYWDVEALAIAENMSGLCHLQLVSNEMTNDGLQAILLGCPQLESLDLRRCGHLDNVNQMCDDRVKFLKLPNAPMDGYDYPSFDIGYDEIRRMYWSNFFDEYYPPEPNAFDGEAFDYHYDEDIDYNINDYLPEYGYYS